MAGRQPVLPPTGRRATAAMRTSSPPSAAWRREQQRLGLQRHRVDDQPAAGAQRRDGGVEHARSLPPPPMKTASGAAVRRALPARCLRRPPGPGTPKAAALRRMRAARSGSRLDGDGAHRGIGQHPFDGDRARAGADVPQQFAAPRRKRRQRHRADLALGDLAVMLEQMRRPGRRASAMTRAPGAASTSIATMLSGSTSARSKACGGASCGCARAGRPALPAP